MEGIVDFFLKKPETIAAKSMRERFDLEAFFVDKNLFRYHQDFYKRWVIIFEKTLVADSQILHDSPDPCHQSVWNYLTERVAPNECNAKGLKKFLSHPDNIIFSNHNFFKKIVQNCETLPEKVKHQAYAYVQGRIKSFVEIFQPNHHKKSLSLPARASGKSLTRLLKHQSHWRSLQSFFIDERGYLTPLFLSLASEALYDHSYSHQPALRKKSSLNYEVGHIKELYRRIAMDISMAVKCLSNFHYRHLNLEEMLDVVTPVRERLQPYQIEVNIEFHQSAQLVFNAQDDYLQEEESSCVFSNESQEQKIALQNFLLDRYLCLAVHHYQDNFHPRSATSFHPMLTIPETLIDDSDSDITTDESSDNSSDNDSSCDSGSGHWRRISFLEDMHHDDDNAHVLTEFANDAYRPWSEFGKKWRRLPQSERWQELVQEIARINRISETFLSVALSSLNQHTQEIPFHSSELLETAERNFQLEAFSRLAFKWGRVELIGVSACYDPETAILPLICPRVAYSTREYALLNEIVEKKLFEHRYQYLDEQTLRALISIKGIPTMAYSTLVHHAFQQHSASLLRQILSEKTPDDGTVENPLDLVESALKDNQHDLILILIDKDPRALDQESWAKIIDWAVTHEKSCPITQLDLYTRLRQEFSLLNADNPTFWHNKLLEQPELFEQRVLFAPSWAYSRENHTQTYFTQLTAEQRLARYRHWLQGLNNPQSHLPTVWQMIDRCENCTETRKMLQCFFMLSSEISDEHIHQVTQSLFFHREQGDHLSAEYDLLILEIFLIKKPQLLKTVLLEYLDKKRPKEDLRQLYTVITPHLHIDSERSFGSELLEAIACKKKEMTTQGKTPKEQWDECRIYQQFAEAKMSAPVEVIFSRISASNSSGSLESCNRLGSSISDDNSTDSYENRQDVVFGDNIENIDMGLILDRSMSPLNLNPSHESETKTRGAATNK